MALIIMQSGKAVTMAAAKTHELYKVLQGETEGTEAQQAFAGNVKAVYFNRANAPQSWLDEHPMAVETRYKTAMNPRKDLV